MEIIPGIDELRREINVEGLWRVWAAVSAGASLEACNNPVETSTERSEPLNTPDKC